MDEHRDRERLRELIHLSGRLLDDKKFDQYVALYCDDGEYRIQTDVADLGKTATWAFLSRQELNSLLASAPRHVWNTGLRSHLITVETMARSGNDALTEAGFCVFHTADSGVTVPYAVGRYEDTWRRESDDWRLARRVARLATRHLAPPSAIPL